MAVELISIAMVGFIAIKTMIKVHSNRINDPSEYKISTRQVRQLICNKIAAKDAEICSIEYIGHGVDFDTFAMTFNSNKYIIRIARHDNDLLLYRLKMEMKYTSLLQKYFQQNNIWIKIPVFNDDTHPICSQLRNLENPHKSYIYATYLMIKGNADEQFELLHSNKLQIAQFLCTLHQFRPHQSDLEWLTDSASQELQWLIEDLEWAQREINLPNTELKQYITTEIYQKVKHVLIPKFKAYEARADNQIISGLIHGDLHDKHILFDTDDTFCGVIDWSDMRVSDVANEFRYILAVSPSATEEIVSKYKEMRRDVIDWRLFDLCMKMYGYITLTLWMHWVIWLKKDECEFLKYERMLRDGIDEWEQCINDILELIK